jgi:hypothetical protein
MVEITEGKGADLCFIAWISARQKTHTFHEAILKNEHHHHV